MSPKPTESAPTTIEALKDLLRDDTKVKVAGIDANGILRGKIMSKDKFLSAAKPTGFGFCSVIFGWDMHDNTYFEELLVSNRANGYKDLTAIVDLETYRRLPWERDMPFFLVRFLMPDSDEPLMVDPRALIRSVVGRAKEQGWKCMSGAEFEYFQYAETPHTIAEKQFVGLKPLTPGMHGYSMIRPSLNVDYFHDLYDQAVGFGINVEGHHTETGPGVYETALEYTETERMADNATLFKLVAKSVGMKYGIMPTFMAKPWGDLPGCSGHIHVSMQDEAGNNLFAITPEEAKAGGRKGAAFKDVGYISELAEYFLAGLLDGLPDVIPMMCPNINSYKRLLGGEAMWAPDRSNYGYDSRAASIRIIGPPYSPVSATRFEVRIPGADMVPHYAMAAIFALGLRGITKKLALPYGPIGSPGVTRDSVKALPTSLEAATQAFKAKDSIAREVFGDFFVDHYAGTREHELEVHRRAVTSWEVERYFELA